LFSLQQEDGPEPKNDDGSTFTFLPVAPVVLFGKNAPPASKVIMQIQPDSAKSASKRKGASDIAAPQAQTKARKMTVSKIQKEARPSSTDQEAPIVNQVWIVPFIIDPLNMYILTYFLFPCLQADIVDISSGEELAHQEDPTPEAPVDPLTMVDALVNLQDPILKTLENLATPVDTLISLQDLQEPIVTSSAVSPSLHEPTVTSSAISPPPERVRLQEPIVTSSAITPSPEQVCFVIELFVSSFPCAVLIFYLLSGSEPLGVAFI
jgi:hypothetical protein